MIKEEEISGLRFEVGHEGHQTMIRSHNGTQVT